MGAIPTGDMTDIMAQVKLMWLLSPQECLGRHKRKSDSFHGRIDMESFRKLVNTNFVGEVTKRR